jgi:hypothetical protein
LNSNKQKDKLGNYVEKAREVTEMLAAEHNRKLYNAIYRYPTVIKKNSWLEFFESKRMRSVPFLDNDRLPQGLCVLDHVPTAMLTSSDT